MLSSYIAEYKGVEDIRKNISDYFNKFEENSVICFRGGDVSKDEQSEIFKIFGDLANWFPNTKALETQQGIDAFNQFSFYSENHWHAFPQNLKNDQIVITWHLEHFYKKNNRTAGAIWNMKTFTCDPESGKTLFVDAHKLWKTLTKEEQQFLANSETYFYYFDEVFTAPCVSIHFRTGEELAHVDFDPKLETRRYLYRYNGFEPSDAETQEFNRIMMFLNHQVKTNEDIRIVHSWRQGDIIIPDLFKLIHTITGGFQPEERYFNGVWAFQHEPNEKNVI